MASDKYYFNGFHKRKGSIVKSKFRIKDHDYKTPLINFILIFLIFLILDYLGYSISDIGIFYTLSTISQTLAALIGIAVMFILFRLQIIHENKIQTFKELKELVEYLINKPNENDMFKFSNLKNFGGDKFLEETKKINDRILNLNPINRENYYYFDWIKIDLFCELVTNLNEMNKEVQFYKFKISLPILIGVLAIVLSIFILPFGDITSEKSILNILNPVYFIGVVVALAIAGIISIVHAFVKMILIKSD